MSRRVRSGEGPRHGINAYLTLFVFGVTFFTVLLLFALWVVGDRLGPFGNAGTLWVILCLLLSVSLLSTLVSSWLSKHALFRALRSACEASRKVAEGDFSQRMDISRERELAELAQCFNLMTEKLSRNEVIAESFVSNVSHEFRNPLSAIRGYAQLLEDESLPPEQRRQYLRVIQEKTVNLSQFVDSVLEMTRLDHQPPPQETEVFSLDEQLRQVILQYGDDWQRKNLDMQVELSPIRYRASRELLSHVWRNLLDNAIKYSDPGGVITVAASQTPGGVEVTIADCGAGMDSETAANMFERYYRGNSAAVGGHGLGAAIAASIVRLMNGSIEVKSELGVGTSVTVRLPGKETA